MMGEKLITLNNQKNIGILALEGIAGDNCTSKIGGGRCYPHQALKAMKKLDGTFDITDYPFCKDIENE